METLSGLDINKLRDMLEVEAERHTTSLPSEDIVQSTNKNIDQSLPILTKLTASVNSRNSKLNPSKPENEIWKLEEIHKINFEESEAQDREVPEHELKQRQNMGVEDVVLGVGDLDPSSAKCSELLLIVKMPRASFEEIWITCENNQLWIQSFDYSLLFNVPCEFDEKEVKTKWLADIKELQLIIKKKGNSYFSM